MAIGGGTNESRTVSACILTAEGEVLVAGGGTVSFLTFSERARHTANTLHRGAGKFLLPPLSTLRRPGSYRLEMECNQSV